MGIQEKVTNRMRSCVCMIYVEVLSYACCVKANRILIEKLGIQIM